MRRLGLLSRHVVQGWRFNDGVAAVLATRASTTSTAARGVALTGHFAQLSGVCAEQAQRAFRGEVATRSDSGLAIATFAGGCFWGPQLFFDRIDGVKATSVGYAQGNMEKPTYRLICSGRSGHTEVVQVYFDDSEVSYDQLLEAFWRLVDPTVVDGQGGDFGPQYRTGIYYHTQEQKLLADASMAREQKNHRLPIATEIAEAGVFWPAEAEHQNYLVNGGRFGRGQSNAKGCRDTIRCYG
eukprot:TRINITY_DN70860_c0_g1_i1.p1 TRINITY_DN70860_c0_g1~~TRINITY_DN70860_c0_g1_i1.p1  ORF type:complete len:240 (-),score=27.41 TRINITY_DN70860_c0_g1_i1:120-839(-)